MFFALNVFSKGPHLNEDLYGILLKLSGKVRERRIRVAGHCVRHRKEEASKLVLCIHNTDKLTEEDLGPRTYTLCLRTLGSPPSENSELQSGAPNEDIVPNHLTQHC